MLAWLLEMAISSFRLPRRWDGMNLSNRGTLRSAIRAIDGPNSSISERWQAYDTAVRERQLWFGRRLVGVASVATDSTRPPRPNERWSLDRDFVIVPFTSVSGATFEWALRGSQLAGAVALLGFAQPSSLQH